MMWSKKALGGLRLVAAFCIAMGTGQAVAAEEILSARDRALYDEVFASLESLDYPTAKAHVAPAENPLLGKVALWQLLRSGGGGADFAARAAFLAENPDWPGRGALILQAEVALLDELEEGARPANEALRYWFAEYSPRTARGLLAYLPLLAAEGDEKAVARLVRQAWMKLDFDAASEMRFVAGYRQYLDPELHERRLTRLLDTRRFTAAKRQARRMGRDYPALAEARIRLARLKGGVDAAIKRVSPRLQQDPGLLYERLRWRQRKGRYEDATVLLESLPPMAERDARRLWRIRNWAARQLLADGEALRAYGIAQAHGLGAGKDFAEAEWLAGWIALRHLGRADRAYAHFTRLAEGVSQPISLARGAYWAAAAAEALAGQAPTSAGATLDVAWPEAAHAWYREALVHGTTFYGQLAARRLGARPQIALPPAPRPEAAARTAFAGREPVRVVRLLHQLGEARRLEPFLHRLRLDAADTGELALVAELAREVGRPDLALLTAKLARRDGTYFVEWLYPQPALIGAGPTDPALTLALIRQESGFYSGAVSRSGARGLMQLMPGTARLVARALEMPYDRENLTADPSYNLRLGRNYLGRMLARFDGSIVLALAAYNAGPHRVTRWLETFGDPRRGEIDYVDWIESIPFSETRNYVQRIVETLPIYRGALNAQGGPGTPFDRATPLLPTRLDAAISESCCT